MVHPSLSDSADSALLSRSATASPASSTSSLAKEPAPVLTEIPLRRSDTAYSDDLEEGLDNDYYATSPLNNSWKSRNTRTIWHRLLMVLRRRTVGHQPTMEVDDISTKALLGKTPAPHKKQRNFSVCGRLCIALPILLLCMLGIVHILDTVLGLGSSIWDYEHDDFMLDWGQPGHIGDGLASYPTDFTRDVVPIPCHSHNDYWRRVPLYQALHYGCTGVEADVWLFADHQDELFVGHNTASLTPNRTFTSLYVNPLVEILNRQNPTSEFTNEGASTPAPRHGVFDKDPEQTVVLLVDFKTDGPTLFPVVQAQLEPLRQKGYLTYYDGASGKTIYGPVTVVATGNAPFDMLIANTTYRDIFFDAPLALMSDVEISASQLASTSPSENPQQLPTSPLSHRRRTSSKHVNRGQGTTGTSDTTALSFNSTNSFYASVDFSSSIGYVWGGRLSHAQLAKLRRQIRGAKTQGLYPRYWGTPSWPIGLRNQIWEVLVREGVGYLNVDDLRWVARRDWGRRGRRHGSNW